MNIFLIAIIMAFFIGEVFLLDMYYKKKYKTAVSNVAPVKADAANPIQNVLPTVIRVVVSEDSNKLAEYKSELADLYFSYSFDQLKKKKSDKENAQNEEEQTAAPAIKKVFAKFADTKFENLLVIKRMK